MARARLSTVNFGSAKTGLATVGYTLYNPDGTSYQARVTAGVVEYGTTGVYGASVTLPTDRPVLVMWDTGEGTPRYGSEDNNTQVDAIQNETDTIRLIWNSLKNQGAFFTMVMDKLGVLEKNKGVVKQDVVDVINGIEFPKAPDFAPTSEAVKSYAQKMEKMMTELSAVLEKRDLGFTNLQKILSAKIDRSSSEAVISELKHIKAAFFRFEALLSKINSFEKSLDGLEKNDKKILQAKEEIKTEISEINKLIQGIAVLNPAQDRREYVKTLTRMYGSKTNG